MAVRERLRWAWNGGRADGRFLRAVRRASRLRFAWRYGWVWGVYDPPGSRWGLLLEFQKRDAWVGVYWDVRHARYPEPRGVTLHVYVCIVPFFPLHLVREIG